MNQNTIQSQLFGLLPKTLFALLNNQSKQSIGASNWSKLTFFKQIVYITAFIKARKNKKERYGYRFASGNHLYSRKLVKNGHGTFQKRTGTLARVRFTIKFITFNSERKGCDFKCSFIVDSSKLFV